MSGGDRCYGENKVMEEDKEYQNRRSCILCRVVWEGLVHKVIYKHRSEGYGGGSHIWLPREEYSRLRGRGLLAIFAEELRSQFDLNQKRRK